MQKILVTGAAGMLGSKVTNAFMEKNNFEVYGTGRKNINPSFNYIRANLLNESELDQLLQSIKPDIIVNCAANVNLSDCELHKEAAYKLHAEVSRRIALYNPGKCKVIYISTDSVFNGISGNYSVGDEPDPYNYYASSKLAGEKAVMNENKNSVIIRTNIYGFNLYATGNSLFEWLYKNLKAHQPLTGFLNVFFNPLYIGQLADIITKLTETETTGIYHAGCKEYISKYDFALLIAEAFSFDKSLIKYGVFNDDDATLKRPKNTTLNAAPLSKLLNEEFFIKDGINQLKYDFTQQKKLHA